MFVKYVDLVFFSCDVLSDFGIMVDLDNQMSFLLLVKIRQGFISRGEETDPTFDGTYGNPTVKVHGHMEM